MSEHEMTRKESVENEGDRIAGGGDYSEVAQASWRAYLKKQGVTLEEASAMVRCVRALGCAQWGCGRIEMRTRLCVRLPCNGVRLLAEDGEGLVSAPALGDVEGDGLEGGVGVSVDGEGGDGVVLDVAFDDEAAVGGEAEGEGVEGVVEAGAEVEVVVGGFWGGLSIGVGYVEGEGEGVGGGVGERVGCRICGWRRGGWRRWRWWLCSLGGR